MPRRGFENYPMSASAAQATTFTTNPQNIPQSRGVLYLAVTAVTGTAPTLDIEVFAVDADLNVYLLGVFNQVTATGTQRMVFDPLLDQAIQCVCTIAGTTPVFTFSLKFDAKEN